MSAAMQDVDVRGAIVVLDDPQHRRPATARRLLGALARIESRRIVLHPAFVLGLLGSIFTLWQQREGDLQQYWMLVGQASTTVGAMTFLVGFLNAARVRRDDAEELYAAFPATAGARTGGILLSLWAAAAVTAAIVAVAWLLEVGPDGEILVALEPLRPSLLEPAQAPLVVAAFGALGVCFGRWTPHTALAPLLTLAIGTGPIAWSIPWVFLGTVPYLPPDHTWLVGPPGWHLLFLTGVIVTAGALALLRDARRPATFVLLAVGAAALALGLPLQFA
jgi:hypothetical protein